MNKDIIKAMMTVTKAARAPDPGSRHEEIDPARIAQARRQLEAMTALELVDALAELSRSPGGVPVFFS